MAFEATGAASFFGLLAAAIGGFAVAGVIYRELRLRRQNIGDDAPVRSVRTASRGLARVPTVGVRHPAAPTRRSPGRSTHRGRGAEPHVSQNCRRGSAFRRQSLGFLTTSVLQGGRNPLGRSARLFVDENSQRPVTKQAVAIGPELMR